MSHDANDLIETKKIITGFVSRALDAVLLPIEGAVKTRIAAVRNRSEQLLQTYLLRKYELARSVKNLIHADEEDIRSLYVPSNFSYRGTAITEDEFFTTLAQTPRRSIIGTAGGGKSSFFRHAIVHEFKTGRLGVPLYVELRDLNDSSSSILDFICRDISATEPHFMNEQLEVGLKQGLFTLLLDGLDELSPTRLKAVTADIAKIAETYNKARILVTSRPLDGPEAWRKFSIFRIAPLQYSQVRSLVSKSGISAEARNAFLLSLTPQFYEQHRSFLEIPLLAIIMALVFREQYEISNAITTFYEDAYSALISRHDATKEYKRLLYCGLERAPFRAVLNNLSARTYGQFKYTFDEIELLKYVQESGRTINRPFSSEEYLTDLTTSVCMIVRDGFRLKYSHRSFQEYFCACFVCSLDGQNAGKLLKKIGSRHDALEVMKFVREISPDMFEAGWLLPSLEATQGQFGAEPEITPAVAIQYIDLLLDIQIHPRQAKYEVSLTSNLGRLIANIEGLGVLSSVDTVSRIISRVESVYNELDEAALERNAFGLENPRRYPIQQELMEFLSTDQQMINSLKELRTSINQCYRALAERRRARDTLMDMMFDLSETS